MSKVNIDKVKKSLKNTGNSVYAIGWITIIINIGLYLWSILDQSFVESGLPASDLSGTFLIVVVMSIFVILGNRIKGLIDKNIKKYLQILLVLSLLILVWNLSAGGRVGLLFLLIIAYLISSLSYISSAMKVEEFTSTLISPKYKLNKKGWTIFVVSASVLLFVAVGVDLSTQKNSGYLPQETTTQTQDNSNDSKTQLITEIVKETKTEMSLPNKIDEVTVLADITAEPSAIRYYYVLSGVDLNQLSNSYLKDSFVSKICENASTKNLLDEGINMEYSYTVKDSSQKYFVSFSKDDCLK